MDDEVEREEKREKVNQGVGRSGLSEWGNGVDDWGSSDGNEDALGMENCSD
jgi:hypothetical protein